MIKLFWAPRRALFLAIFLLPLSVSAQNNLATAKGDQDQVSVLGGKAALGDTGRSGSPVDEILAGKAISLNNAGVDLARVNSNLEAIDQFNRAIEIDPDLAVAYLNLSIVYDRMNRIPEALSAASRALALDSQNATARMQVCELTVISRLIDKARLCYEEMKKTGPLDEQSVKNYILILLKSGDLAAAKDAIENAIKRSPTDPALLNGLGLLHYREKKYDEAVTAFKQATEIDPEMDAARFNLALAQLAKSNRAGALSQYRLLEESNSKLANALYRLLYKDRILYVGDKRK